MNERKGNSGAEDVTHKLSNPKGVAGTEVSSRGEDILKIQILSKVYSNYINSIYNFFF